ncbi:uncharacterized protein BP01DRAFT_386502 [Aspergillus saccharolyticus JOP 1030-1]|uniref:Uncharacterized protein n=1 Tax=Aspergillus saccharolyticus JOP 1030-1 TaxID=1450539 RepID=A0A318Z4S4_9EURO|nr:hypothetical protein BP01DRAFT_386502 [Aspergillus saccharolyticus JOP 1030-1]PYH41367.1 hypothetical protein BP01DRAFT_386502 [Aspergillus saccharolyticus JOP 1030-1]
MSGGDDLIWLDARQHGSSTPSLASETGSLLIDSRLRPGELPEAIFNIPWGSAIAMWNLAALVILASLMPSDLSRSKRST